jgi:hypothetical protein
VWLGPPDNEMGGVVALELLVALLLMPNPRVLFFKSTLVVSAAADIPFHLAKDVEEVGHRSEGLRGKRVGFALER